MLGTIILATVLVSAISLIGVLLFFLKKPLSHIQLQYLLSFAAGSLLAVTFSDILPEAFNTDLDPVLFFNVMLGSLVVFWLIERLLHWHHNSVCEKNGTYPEIDSKHHLVWLNLIGSGLHNFLDGVVMAGTFLIDPALGWATAIATMAHEFPHEFGDVSVLLYAGLEKKKVVWWNWGAAIVAVLGGLAGYFFLSDFSDWLPYLLAIAASNFLYLSLADLLPELTHHHKFSFWLKQTGCFLLGIVLIYTVVGLLG